MRAWLAAPSEANLTLACQAVSFELYEDEDLDVEELQAGAFCDHHEMVAQTVVRIWLLTVSELSKMQRFRRRLCPLKVWFPGSGCAALLQVRWCLILTLACALQE